MRDNTMCKYIQFSHPSFSNPYMEVQYGSNKHVISFRYKSKYPMVKRQKEFTKVNLVGGKVTPSKVEAQTLLNWIDSNLSREAADLVKRALTKKDRRIVFA